MIFILLFVMVTLAILRPSQFYQVRIFQSMMFQFPEYGLLAVGVMLALICGGTDLSTIGVANLSGILCAKLLLVLFPAETSGFQTVMAIVITLVTGLVIGAACGAFNALLIYRIEIPAIVATIGTLRLYTGIGIGLTGGAAVSGFVIGISRFVQSSLFGILPIPTLLFLLCVPLLYFLMEKTSFGINLRLQGTSPKAALYAGIHKGKIHMQTYILSGCLASITGFIMMGRMNSVKADYGISYTLLSILICVLGGISPKGGKGRVFGVALATVTLQFVSSGMATFRQLNPFYNQLVFGFLLLLALLLDHYSDKPRERNLLRKKKVNSCV